MKGVPRYTSYPTAPHFHDGIKAQKYIKWLKELDADTSLSLYFHIPYCKQLCWFCGCHTKIVNGYSSVSKYIELLKQEVLMIAPLIKHLPVKHIHFGGGSPTILSPTDFSEFMALISEQFRLTDSAEIAVEMDPRTVDMDKIISYAESGVTRASLGVQDFDPKVQEAINRVQDYELVEKVVNNLRSSNINALNIDLIYGLPYQTTKTTIATIERSLSLDPDRISLFGYAHVPWMKQHQKLVPEDALPSKEERVILSELARKLILEAGYTAIGIDHFAKADDALSTAASSNKLQRNFQGYTTDNADALIGFGVSSISSLPQGYLQNTAKNVDYAADIKNKKLPIARGVELSTEDKQRRDIIMSLMCNFQVKIKADLYAPELERLQPYIDSGDVCFSDGVIKVNSHSQNKLRLVASIFDTYLQNSPHRYSQAV